MNAMDHEMRADCLVRRDKLGKMIGEGAIAVLIAAPEKLRTETAHYPYRQDNAFFYLTGLNEPEGILIIIGGVQPRSIFFSPPFSAEKARWEGRQKSPIELLEELGVDQSYELDELQMHFFKWAKDKKIYADIERLRNHPRFRELIDFKNRELWGNLGEVLGKMRLHKSKHEQVLLQKAVDISVLAHLQGMETVKPDEYEYQLAARYEYVFQSEGASAPAYASIVGGGKNGCILHYRNNADKLKSGDLVLVDAAAEYKGYAADITRTYPVNGVFSAPARAIYEIVLAAQSHAIEAMRPGATWEMVQSRVVTILTQGLLELGLLKGYLEENIAEKHYRRFYMHSAGHWLGLDVHDACPYRTATQEPIAFEPDMTMTIEPGLYISPSPDVNEAFWNIAVRIEDDILITEKGCQILSARLPRTVDEIEALRRK